MSEEKVLTLRGKKAVWAPGGGSGPIDPKRLPEGYPYKESRVTVDLSAIYGAPGVVFCKVTGETPEPSASRTKIKIWSNSSDEPNTVGLDNNDENCIMSQSGLVAVAFKDGVVVKPSADVEINLPEKGVYFLDMAGAIIVTGVAWDSTATEPDITWDGVVETIHTMAPEFLPAGVGGGGAFIVKLTIQDGTPVLDKTYEEIRAAIVSGNYVECQMSEYDDAPELVTVFHVSGISPDADERICFYSIPPIHSHSPSGAIQVYMLRLSNDGTLDLLQYEISATT